MDEIIAFGCSEYWVMLGLLLFARGMDLLSTRFATPTLALEANPLAKWLGWKGGLAFNVALSFAVAFCPMAAVILTTTSLLVASRNFKSAFLMRALGEVNYSLLVGNALREGGRTSFVLCVLGETILFGLVGGAVIWAADGDALIWGLGFGLVAYALAVAFYSLLGLRRR